jgi:dCMP deaminase
MGLCQAVSVRSKDESTKLGCVIAGPDKFLRATGYNSFPTGIQNRPERQERPEKYKWFEHAERNAIYSAARNGVSLLGCTLYCQWLPCSDCARAIIQVGIVRVIVSSFETPERWHGNINTAITMLEEANVLIGLPDRGACSYAFIRHKASQDG